MKIVELLKIGMEILKMLHENGIQVEDYLYLPLIADYLQMKRAGDKTTYAVMFLSEKYNICERKVYKILSRLLKDCQ